MGQKIFVSEIEAKLFPEQTFVRDLVYNYANMAEEITENEYNDRKGNNS